MKRRTASASSEFRRERLKSVMPELPEVETMRRGIEPIVGSRIRSVSRPLCDRRPIQITPSVELIEQRVQDKTIVAIGRRGKRVLIKLDDQQTIVIEPRMTGLVLLVAPPTTETSESTCQVVV